jgi:hypothetical protein
MTLKSLLSEGNRNDRPATVLHRDHNSGRCHLAYQHEREVMTDTPPDWVLIEAAKRCEWSTELGLLHQQHHDNPVYVALCDMILKHEQPPVDRKLLCAREAVADWEWVKSEDAAVAAFVRAIELWEEGFGQ